MDDNANMRQVLSSRVTFVRRFILPSCWVTALTLIFLLSPLSFDYCVVLIPFLILGIVATHSFWKDAEKFKKVSADEEFLYVSDYRREIQVSLAEIEQVNQSGWSRGRYDAVWIVFRGPSVIGREVYFVPKGRHTFGIHPVIGKLREDVAAVKSQERANDDEDVV